MCGGHVLVFGRVGEARVAEPGGARDGGGVWVSGWAARGEGHGRGWCGGVCCVGVCVRSPRRACVASCRPGGLEEKLAVFCCRGKDFADELAYLVDLFVSGGKGVCQLWAKTHAAEDPVAGVVPAGEGLLRSGGGGVGRVSGPASTCVWAVGMAQTQGTVPVGGQRRWIQSVRQSMANPRW